MAQMDCPSLGQTGADCRRLQANARLIGSLGGLNGRSVQQVEYLEPATSVALMGIERRLQTGEQTVAADAGSGAHDPTAAVRFGNPVEQ